MSGKDVNVLTLRLRELLSQKPSLMKRVKPVKRDGLLMDALHELLRYGVVPVIDDAKKVVGMLTVNDIFRKIVDITWGGKKPLKVGDIEHILHLKAHYVMEPAIKATVSMKVEDVIRLGITSRRDYVIVTADDGTFLCVLFLTDLLKELLGGEVLGGNR